MVRTPLELRCHIELFLCDDVTRSCFFWERASPLQTFDFIKGVFSSNWSNKLSNKLLPSYLLRLCFERRGSPRRVQPAVSLKAFWLKHRAIKIDLDSDSFFHLSFTHLFALVKCPFTHFTTWLITCCCFQFIVFFYPPCHGVLFALRSTCIRHRDKCGCHDTRGSQWAQWNQRVCCVQPLTDRPVQSKLAFHLLTYRPCWLLILLTVHFLCPSIAN